MATSIAAMLFLVVLPMPQGPSPRYVHAVALYASGARTAAVSQIGLFTDADLNRELTALRLMLATCDPDCRERERKVPLRAALMLHTDRSLVDRAERQDGRGEPACAPSFQTLVAMEIAGIAAHRDPALSAFAWRWSIAMGIHARAAGCMESALRFVELGLRWRVHDPQLLFVRGTIYETLAEALRGSPPTTTMSQGPATPVEQALGSFEEALSADPALTEARLHLGRMQWRAGRLTLARASLRTVLEGRPEPQIAYLAHMFLGRVEEDAGLFDQGRREYEDALRVDPASQVAAVGLSHALLVSGDEPAAREVLSTAVGHAPRSAGDPYWDYARGGGSMARSLLEALRRECLH